MGLFDKLFGKGKDPAREAEAKRKAEADDFVADAGTFDFARDIARYFTAEFRIETARGNPDRQAELFALYGIRDAAHWAQIEATFQRWLQSDEGRAQYPNDAAVDRARMTTTQTVTVDELGLGKPD